MSDPVAGETYLSRQPILDLRQEMVGYELLLAGGDRTAAHSPANAAMLVCAAYAEFGLRSAFGQNKAFIPADLAFIHDDVIEALPPDSVVLELVFDDAPDKATLERCRALRERRYSLALANYRAAKGDLSAVLVTRAQVLEARMRLIDLQAQRDGLVVRLNNLIAD